jgi:hypothetical protein
VLRQKDAIRQECQQHERDQRQRQQHRLGSTQLNEAQRLPEGGPKRLPEAGDLKGAGQGGHDHDAGLLEEQQGDGEGAEEGGVEQTHGREQEVQDVQVAHGDVAGPGQERRKDHGDGGEEQPGFEEFEQDVVDVQGVPGTKKVVPHGPGQRGDGERLTHVGMAGEYQGPNASTRTGHGT